MTPSLRVIMQCQEAMPVSVAFNREHVLTCFLCTYQGLWVVHTTHPGNGATTILTDLKRHKMMAMVFETLDS